MKTTFNKAMQAAVAAAALTFATASYASPEVYNSDFSAGANLNQSINATGAAFFGQDREWNGDFSIDVQVFQMVNAGKPSQQYVAYCIEPAINFNGGDYTATYNSQPSTAVRKLFESSYASTQGNSTNQFAFQLALWELANDDANLATGAQKYVINAGSPAEFQAAQTMLSNALAYNLTTDHYSYVTFSNAGSQTLLGVSAVPEADTWAMMAVGLGLVGLVGRRKQKNEKFA
ncbi:PEP-CTERM sorting domain-containing protein [Duganella qianjiadongensis]|uniref:Cys-Gln thioester bond-forming surface protein n=1 Tax=Duganella qianjiadongensis TaxID=2692176 RepID=A0ABW9VKH6_9BURK|nr:PEP-CTERM sorting domain-containing protein [Duganella qianjiadongensis]MYM39852.1 Cys-Gln thioester bond-forming surface protein [Duganella qianjiadongensis]